MPGGQGFNAGQGDVASARAVLLRSNKNVTTVSVQLSGQNVGVPQGTFSTARARLLTGINLASQQYSFGGSILPEWNVGAISVQAGASGQPAGQSSLAGTLPGGITAGGVYRLDNTSNSLPAGMTLSEAGVVDVGSASIGTQSGVVFAYSEPGALPTLTLHSTAAGSFLPYMATVYPPEGVVPSGMILVSPDDDPTFRSSVLSTWPDGSAQVVVGAGHKASVNANSTATVRLRPGLPSAPALTTAHIDSLLTSIEVNFGVPLVLTDFTNSYDRVWWANTQVICARYRIPISNLDAMEAVIDVHAFALGRVFVEVVIENGQVVPASPVKPASQNYTNATVAVNGVQIQGGSGVSSSAGVNATHEAFRAWYCSGWVGGNPGLDVTHDAASMQAHPLLFKPSASSSVDLQAAYQSDLYAPWSIVRQSASMGGTGDHESIGPLPKWEAQYIQSGNRYARNAVIQSGLGLLTYNFHYRDQATHLPMAISSVAGFSVAAGYPGTGDAPFANYSYACWDYAHQPAVGLVAFLCRPSPCFIELAQKCAVFNALGENNGQQRLGYWFEQRGRAWGWRNIAHAAFLTPDNQASLKADIKANLATNVNYLRQWDLSPEDKLNVFLDYDWTDYRDVGNPGTQQSIWMHHFTAPELLKAHDAKLLTGSDQVNLGALVDWALLQPVRWVNEQSNGGWRYIGYRTVVGTTSGATVGQSNDWGAMRATINPTNPATVGGPWMSSGGDDLTTYAAGWTQENGMPFSVGVYVLSFWTALCAAVERGVSGAETAWNTVNDPVNGVTNLPTFKASGALDPRHLAYPRNK